MNPAYVSAFSALAGALIGGLSAFGSSWFTQQSRIRDAHSEAEKAKLELLYNDFIVEAARLFGDALSHQTNDISNMMPLYALVGRMRLVSDRAVIDAAVKIEQTIIRTYLEPNRDFQESWEFARSGGANFLTEFGEACRKDIAARAR